MRFLNFIGSVTALAAVGLSQQTNSIALIAASSDNNANIQSKPIQVNSDVLAIGAGGAPVISSFTDGALTINGKESPSNLAIDPSTSQLVLSSSPDSGFSLSDGFLAYAGSQSFSAVSDPASPGAYLVYAGSVNGSIPFAIRAEPNDNTPVVTETASASEDDVVIITETAYASDTPTTTTASSTVSIATTVTTTSSAETAVSNVTVVSTNPASVVSTTATTTLLAVSASGPPQPTGIVSNPFITMAYTAPGRSTQFVTGYTAAENDTVIGRYASTLPPSVSLDIPSGDSNPGGCPGTPLNNVTSASESVYPNCDGVDHRCTDTAGKRVCVTSSAAPQPSPSNDTLPGQVNAGGSKAANGVVAFIGAAAAGLIVF